MIELPFGNGVTAALVFAAFELVVIPILMDSTSLIAWFLITLRAKKGKSIHVKTFQYALWNEGLLSTQKSHLFLFLFRIVIIVIPVYLQSRLIYKEEAVMVNTQLRNAFVLVERVDPALSESYKTNPEGYARAFDICSYVNEDEWLVASNVNVSFAQDEEHDFGPFFGSHSELLHEAKCIKSSERELLRMIGQPDVESDLFERQVSVNFSERTYGVFDMGVNVAINVSLNDEHDVQCFTPITDVRNSGSQMWWCHRKQGLFVDFYELLMEVDIFDMSSNVSEPDVRFQPEVVLGRLFSGFRLEFHEHVLFDAEALANTFIHARVTHLQLYEQIGEHLYARAQNVSMRVASNEMTQRTVLDDVVVTVGAVHLGVVLMVALGARLCARRAARGDVRALNTVDGVSETWARALESARAAGERREGGELGDGARVQGARGVVLRLGARRRLVAVER